MTDKSDDRTAEEKEAAAAALKAEAARHEAEAEKFRVEARQLAAVAAQAELAYERAQFETAKARESEASRLADDDHNLLYRFAGAVSEKSVKEAVAKLVQWHRLYPKAPLTIVVDSPGGNIVDGFHLFDTILWLRSKGHYVTIIGQGMAASMAGVILQAADRRVMTKQASLLIHEAQFGAIGTMGEVKDTVEFVELLQNRILEIFADRSKLSKSQIKSRWSRKNWWMLADEALKLGFVDAVE